MVLSELVPTGIRTTALTLVECVCILCATERCRFRKHTQALHNVILGRQRVHQMHLHPYPAMNDRDHYTVRKISKFLSTKIMLKLHCQK